MFFLKKFLSPLLFPVPIIVLLLGVGLALLWFTRRQRTGKVFVTSGFALLVVLSCTWATFPLLHSLERIHGTPIETALAPAKWVVVLGGGTYADPSLPLIARANTGTITRLVEGIRLHRQLPGSRLLLSGSGVLGSGSDAESMAAIAVALGVPAVSIVRDDESPDTETQAVNVARIVKDEPFLLVTSASHMPRAVALFTGAGLKPLPAPAHYIAQASSLPADYYPGIRGLLAAQIVESEYLGIVWARLLRKL